MGKTILDNHALKDVRLGNHLVNATVYYEGKFQNVNLPLVVLNSKAPKVFTYTIINEYPHDINSYTQGLEFFNGHLYESTGQYGESKTSENKLQNRRDSKSH